MLSSTSAQTLCPYELAIKIAEGAALYAKHMSLVHFDRPRATSAWRKWARANPSLEGAARATRVQMFTAALDIVYDV